MRLSRSIIPVLCLVTGIPCVPVNAAAHEFWISPSTYRAAAGDTVALRVAVGTGFRGEMKPWATPRAVRFRMQGARTVDLAPAAMNGDLVWARFVAADGGGALIAYQSNYVPIELPSAEFDAYLKLEGLDGPRAERSRRGAASGIGRERYARCPKCWIAGERADRACAPAGLPLEIVPLADPTTANPLRVRVLFRGRPLAGVRVRAWNRPLAGDAAPLDPTRRDSIGVSLETRTAADGTATLDLVKTGEWMLGAVHMVPSEVPAEADWQSLWASFTFARPPRPR